MPHNGIRLQPLRPRAVRIQHRIPTLDSVQRPQDWILRRLEAVAAHPLDLTNPDRNTRQFGGIGVELDPQHIFGPDSWSGLFSAEPFAIDVGAVFDIIYPIGKSSVRERGGPE